MTRISAERLHEALASAAHLLPAQGPIGVFVHHNTLHAFQHKPFFAAVEEAANIHGAEPYLSEERFRAELAKGRILLQDLSAEVECELTLRGHERGCEVFPGLTRSKLWHLLLLHEIEPLGGPSLAWRLTQGRRLGRLRSRMPQDARLRVLADTRAWFQRRVEAGDDLETLAGLVTPGLKGKSAESYLLEALDLPWRRSALEALPWRDPEALGAACLQAACVVAARSLPPIPSSEAPTRPRPRDRILASAGFDADALVHPFLIPWVSAYVDQGGAYWPIEGRAEGLFTCLAKSWTLAGSLLQGWQRGLQRRMETIIRLRQTPTEVVLSELELLGISEEVLEEFLAQTLLALPGWAGIVQVLEQRPESAPNQAPDLSLLEFLALRLPLDRFAATFLARRNLGLTNLRALPPVPAQAPANSSERAWVLREVAELAGISAPALRKTGQDAVATLLDEVVAFDEVSRRRVWHLAYERTHRDEVLAATRTHWLAVQALNPPAPRIQAVFCIDEREESIRRHLEEQGPQFETFGAAGFYNLAIHYKALDEPRTAPLCPVAANPVHQIHEEPALSQEVGHKRRRVRRKALGRVVHTLRVSSEHVVGGLLSTLGYGLLSAFPLVSETLFPRWNATILGEWEGAIGSKPTTELTAFRSGEAEPPSGEFPIGFTVGEAVARVGSLLEDMGLTQAFADLVAIFGHGSQSLNNPHESAHDCGACSGRHGGPNARLFATLANNPEVRSGLISEHGIEIPATTWFVGGFHDTCTSGVTYFDVHESPSSHGELLAELRDGIEIARTLSAHERCRRFESASLGLTPAEALRHVEGRATHLAQPRPEYGHATNALCLVGRRRWSRGLFLDRRAFLVSYDPTRDESLDILTRLLTSVGPVGAGINLEYYFSFVDNERYGSGTKLPHNITGLLGVMNGHRSDLRTGLPWQMVEIHEPVRLLTIVEATPASLEEVAARSPEVAELVGGAWINLISMHPETGELQRYTTAGFEPYVVRPSQLPSAPTSVDYYKGERGHLPPAQISAGQEFAA
ncbi:MAG: DUF2309 domain-containing protein [Planctomycetes bacterium]|nr:DUF2309 domain-containing protein [Planctomycetota bacterium]